MKPSSRWSQRPSTADKLSVDRIVEGALEEIEREGLQGLSMRKLAQRLGVEAMSLYHHFPSKQHLLDALVDHAILSVPSPPSDLTPLERLRFALYEYRAMANRFPALYPLIAVHRLNTPVGVRYVETNVALTYAVVPDDQLAARHFRVLGYYITGAGLDESSGYAKGPSAAEPVDDEFVTRECPVLARAAPYFKAQHWDKTFALGIEALIEAVQRDAAKLKTKKRRAR